MSIGMRICGAWRAGFLAGIVLLCAAVAQAESWCDIVFKDVAEEADLIVLAELRREANRSPALYVVETLRGEWGNEPLELSPAKLAEYGVKRKDQVLLALTEKRRLVTAARGMGACTAISILPIRDGLLRARDRMNYDSRRGALSLDQLRHELASGRGSARGTP